MCLQHEKIGECAVVSKLDETWGEKASVHCKLEHLSSPWHDPSQVTAVCHQGQCWTSVKKTVSTIALAFSILRAGGRMYRWFWGRLYTWCPGVACTRDSCQRVKIEGSLARNARVEAHTCLLLSLWLLSGFAMSIGNDMLTTCKDKHECDVRSRLCSAAITAIFQFDFNYFKKDG